MPASLATGYVTRILTSLPFGNIIGGPMKAAVEAQALAARSTLEFIQSVGFTNQNDDAMFPAIQQTPPAGQTSAVQVGTISESNASSQIGSVRSLTFSYTTQDANGEDISASLTVPILAVVPIPYLRIESMSIDFTVKINEEFKRETNGNTSVEGTTGGNIGYKNFWSPVNVGFNGSVSTKHSSSSQTSSRYATEATMNVHVHVVQDSIPAGMAKVLQILESTIRNPNT